MNKVFAFIRDNTRIIQQTIIRNLRSDLKYKFRLLLNSMYTFINLALFTVIANVVQPKQGALPLAYTLGATIINEDGFEVPDYTLGFLKFLFIGTWFWAVFTRPFEDTVTCLVEETQKGTIGLLITNNVSITHLLVGRFFASLLISICLSTAVVLPFFGLLGMLNEGTLLALPLIILTFLSMLVFMLCVSLWVASFSLLFKKTGVLSNVFIYGLKVAAGMYFPVFGLGNTALVLGAVPVASGLDLLRDLFITGNIQPHGTAAIQFMNWDHESWMQFALFVLQSQVFGLIAMILICYVSINQYTKKAKLMGTIETY